MRRRRHAYSTTNSLEPSKAWGLMAASSRLPRRDLREEQTRERVWFLGAEPPPATHNACILVPLKAPLATSVMPLLMSHLSEERSQVTDRK